MHKRFVLGIDRAKMRIYDCEQSEQTLVDSGSDEEYNDEDSKDKFKGFQF